MKNLKIFLALSIFFVNINFSFSQETLTNQDESYLKLRDLFSRHIIPATAGYLDLSSSEKKCSGFSIILNVKNDSITVVSTTAIQSWIDIRQPEFVKRLNQGLKESGIVFDEDCVVVFPVLKVWKDGKDREDNLEETMSHLYEEGLQFSDVKCLRMENPVFSYLLHVKRQLTN
jgi:hypothetical protein